MKPELKQNYPPKIKAIIAVCIAIIFMVALWAVIYLPKIAIEKADLMAKKYNAVECGEKYCIFNDENQFVLCRFIKINDIDYFGDCYVKGVVFNAS